MCEFPQLGVGVACPPPAPHPPSPGAHPATPEKLRGPSLPTDGFKAHVHQVYFWTAFLSKGIRLKDYV